MLCWVLSQIQSISQQVVRNGANLQTNVSSNNLINQIRMRDQAEPMSYSLSPHENAIKQILIPVLVRFSCMQIEVHLVLCLDLKPHKVGPKFLDGWRRVLFSHHVKPTYQICMIFFSKDVSDES